MATSEPNRAGVERGAPTAPRRVWAVAAASVAALTLAVGLGGCVAGDVPAAPTDDPVLVEGRLLYSANCVNCHGTDGGGGIGSKLNGGRLVERYPDPAEQFMVVSDGRRAMPPFSAKLTADELEAVVRYTREIIAEQ